MFISIQYGFILLVITILINSVFNLCKQKIFYICYMLISFILGVAGGVWCSLLPRELYFQLQSRFSKDRLDEEFIIWAIDKFKLYALNTLVVTSIVLLICACIFIIKRIKKDNKLWYIIGYIVNIYRFILILFGFCYSFQTINKEFDIARYIMNMTIAECLLLYVPLMIKKTLLWKRDFKTNKCNTL